jgi:hypothetical protein
MIYALVLVNFRIHNGRERVMLKKAKILTALISLVSANAMAITVTTTDDANTLANEILGSGISIVGGSATYIGTATQSGTFTDGSVIGIESGIILTSGNANDADGPNLDDATTTSIGSAGDADLNTLVAPNATTDAAVLEFDFESAGGDLFFNFVFASEEYNEFVNSSFNDVYGFFVDGVNIALAPNGDVAAINTINCGNPFSGVGPNCDSFNNNDPSGGIPTPFDIEYDGFTDVLTAELLGLSAGVHHIKIAIADTSDTILDSAVFIQAGSFSDTPTPTVVAPGPLALLAFGLVGLIAQQRKKSRNAAA